MTGRGRAMSQRTGVHMRPSLAVGSVLLAGAVVWAMACSEGMGPEGPGQHLAGLTVSAPVATSPGARTLGSTAAAANTVAYVSLVPGAVPTGRSATITNRATGLAVTVGVVNGGFDPVAVAAAVGDTLAIVIARDGSGPLDDVEPVLPVHPPVVVRTDPPRKQVDVPLNTSVMIVFSEPIDSASLGSEAVQLYQGTSPVVGTLAFADPAHLTVVLQPGNLLAPLTDYRFLVSSTIRDINGLALETDLEVPFTTGTTTAPALRITTTTTGGELDPDGYAVCVDPAADSLTCASGGPARIADNGTVTVFVDPGTHLVELRGVAANCAVTFGDNPVTVTVGSGDTTVVGFAVACAQSVLRVTTTTSGPSPDADGYTVCTDPYDDPWSFGQDCTLQVAVGASGAVTVPLSAGQHTVQLDSVAANCTVSGDNPRTVTIADTVDVSFAISCVPAGSVRFYIVTDPGGDNPGGYVVCLDPASLVSFGLGSQTTAEGCAWEDVVALNTTMVRGGVTAGPHQVFFFRYYNNCGVAGGDTRAVTVPYDSTVNVEFDVRCAAAGSVILSNGDSLMTRSAIGGGAGTLGVGSAPAWSPDGLQVAYECAQDICVANPDGSGARQLTFVTFGGAAQHPAWSPDGSKIAFAANPGGIPQLYVMAPDGSGVTRLTDSTWFVGSPAWSPDGTRIAFDCRVDPGNDDICQVNADGSGFTRLTSDPARDYGAAWKPDGSLLAFATTRFGTDEIAYLDPTDGSVSRIGTGLSGFEPAWSPDGIRIAYVAPSSASCGHLVMVSRTDDWFGNGIACGDHPAWHP
jgi:hypothetical protein